MSTNATRPRSVLVVDDDSDTAEMLGLVLGMRGHQVRTAHDGLTALRLAEELQPDAVILDVSLPGVDGCEVARRLRALPDGMRLLIIASTGWTSQQDRARTAAAGFDVHMVKPLDLDRLAELLDAGRPGQVKRA